MEDLNLPDSTRSATSWAILADKGYVGLEEDIRIITPIKGSNLTHSQTQFNKKVGNDRSFISHFSLTNWNLILA